MRGKDVKKHYFHIFNYFCIIRFAAKRNSGKYIPNGLITSDTEQVDAFDVFNPSIGEFKAKTNIVYVFSFDSRIYDSIKKMKIPDIKLQVAKLAISFRTTLVEYGLI